MNRYWKDMYGKRSADFIDGVVAAMEAYAVWHDGKQYIGVGMQPLDEAVAEAREQMGGCDEVERRGD
jgi:hypothetical protein